MTPNGGLDQADAFDAAAEAYDLRHGLRREVRVAAEAQLAARAHLGGLWRQPTQVGVQGGNQSVGTKGQKTL